MAQREEHAARAKAKTKAERRPVLRVLATIGLVILITGAMLACMAALYVRLVIMPDAKLELTDYTLNLTTTVYQTNSATGEREVAQSLHGTENRIWVEYKDIPKYLLDAAVAIEDKRFYKHGGVDWIRTMYGVVSLFTGQDIQGGSTITQQLIKNLTSENQVTVKRKVTEIFTALNLEKNYTKEDILQYYLNCIFLGEGCNGVYTAAYAYFDKPLNELTLAECASLIGITNNPSLFNPYRNPEKNKERQENILWQMLDQKKITQEEYDQAIAEELKFARGDGEAKPATVYSWYVDAVIDEVINDLCEKYNYSYQQAENMVYSGGLQIESNMNKQVQEIVERVYSDRNNLNYTSSTGLKMQSGITVVDNSNGKVVALAGGIGEKTGSRSWNRATRTLRPPGSSIKPLAVYAPAIEMGYITPISVENDSNYSVLNGKLWPRNYDNTYRRANITMIEALRNSYNTVAVKVLANYVTPQVSFEFMRDRFHINLVESRTENGQVKSDIDLAPLALGGLTDGVSTFDMAAAYSTFAREGVYFEPSTYSRVLANDGTVLLEHSNEGQVILKPKTTYYINDMLENVINNGTGTAAKFGGMTIAGKTGTTSDSKDLWFAGYTPYYTAVVWTGYDKQIEMANGTNAQVLWKKVMQPLHNGLENKQFAKPNSSELVAVSYCKVSGKLATGNCAGATGVYSLLKEDVPKDYCTAHKRQQPVDRPPSFDINNKDTWPNDPNFKPEDPSTWPGASGGTGGGNGEQPPQVDPPTTTDPPPTTPDPPATTDPPANTPQE